MLHIIRMYYYYQDYGLLKSLNILLKAMKIQASNNYSSPNFPLGFLFTCNLLQYLDIVL